MKTKIHYLLTPLTPHHDRYKDEITRPIELIKEYLEYINQINLYDFCQYDSDTRPDEINYFIIFAPTRFFRNKDQNRMHYAVVSPIWHRYFLKNHPEAKILLLANVANHDSLSNYINLLELSENFQDHLDQAKPVNEFKFYKDIERGIFIDEWKDQTTLRGHDIIDRMKKILKGGHQRNKQGSNISKTLVDLHFHFNTLEGHLREGRDWDETVQKFLNDDTRQYWERLKDNWNHHQRDLALTPFAAPINQINEKMQKIETFMNTPQMELNSDNILTILPSQYVKQIESRINSINVYICENKFYNRISKLYYE